MMKKIIRFASCGTLELPHDMACFFCKPSISEADPKGSTPRKLKKCSQPWDHSWSKHREKESVKLFCKLQSYLGYKDT